MTAFAFMCGLNAATAAETITYGSLPDPGYDAVVWAIENGKVSDPNVTLKIERVSSIPALMQAAMTQQFNLMPNGVLSLPQMRESGLKVKVLSTLLRYHPEGHSADIWVMPNSPYKTIQDLKGKTIAVVSGESQVVISVRWAISERFGMNADLVGGDFRWVEMPQAQFEAALQSGRVDAAQFNLVPSYSATKDGKYRSVLQGSKELDRMFGGPMPSNFLFGYEDDMNKRPDAYVAAGKLLKASADYVLKNPDEVFAAVAPKYKMSKDDLQTWFVTYAQMPMSVGPTDKSVMMKAWQVGLKMGMLKKVPDSADELMWSKAIMQ
ncbi:ABC transporter substrate-binding protein [Methylocella sp. CPCC 101449]|uniref:ABC transporter substrate-binding protein n=1 Tax=Methylocella sp. CPCC 101449 TaxID=2987531 RepID=UPI00288D9199|nr:ABC transporter substrate-binding protein [Methylocella sp. CPCC 101449]MDT2021285.1 ABC transporter substrate-binding protein [Methylocella sp. CPCC 101449]